MEIEEEVIISVFVFALMFILRTLHPVNKMMIQWALYLLTHRLSIQDPEVILQEVTDNLQHNAPIQAVDLLLEADMIHCIVDMKEVDNTNVWKICQYLLRIVHFHYEESERMKIYEVQYCVSVFNTRLPIVFSVVLICGQTDSSVLFQ